MTRTVLFAGGGTAGHVFPALAVARALTRLADDVTPVFVGVEDRLETRLVPEAGFELVAIDAAAIPRRPSPALLRVPAALRRGVRSCRELIRERRAVGAVTFGGYVSFPLDRAAFQEQLPLVVHEQNSVPGLANRVAAGWADRIAVTFPGSTTRFRYQERCVVTGDPVRVDVLELDRPARRRPAREQLGLDPDRPTLLVFGGSQGARSINRAAVDAHGRWQGRDLQVLHATGRAGLDAAERDWERARAAHPDGPQVRTIGFIDDMAAAYAAADIVVCRAGATSIAELTVLGIPSVLVPYPHATADHQRENAAALARAGGAVLIEDDELDGDRLVAAVAPLLDDPALAEAMARSARAFGRPDAAEAVARLVLDLIPEGARP
ncbi:MAG: undecaprenyldiphospho-muramoylpentapeptide beta-N-acetylglucosaminyltransferase [Nitriliruptoraceae bacterium]